MKKNNLELIIILIIAIGTPIGATLLYLFYPPTNTTNYGELFGPVSINEKILPNDYAQWQLLVVDTKNCDQKCQERLCMIRQVQLVNIGEINRISRLFLVDENSEVKNSIKVAPACNKNLDAAKLELAKIDVMDGLSVSRLASKNIHNLLQINNESNFEEYIYLVDPNLQIMMRYSQDTPIKNIVKDLKRLLRLSKTIS